MALFRLFRHSIGFYAVFVNLVMVLTPELAAAASSSSESSQSYLNQQALNDILDRAAPIAGKIFIPTSFRAFMTNVIKASTKVVQWISTHAIGWPSSLIARSSFIWTCLEPMILPPVEFWNIFYLTYHLQTLWYSKGNYSDATQASLTRFTGR